MPKLHPAVFGIAGHFVIAGQVEVIAFARQGQVEV